MNVQADFDVEIEIDDSLIMESMNIEVSNSFNSLLTIVNLTGAITDQGLQTATKFFESSEDYYRLHPYEIVWRNIHHYFGDNQTQYLNTCDFFLNQDGTVLVSKLGKLIREIP